MIYLCRHGETAANAEDRIQGQWESPLSPRGHAQAEAMAELLHRLVPDPAGWRLVASPLGRCRQTAGAIGAHLGLQPAFDDRLMEINVGDWQGRLRAEVTAADPQAFLDKFWCFRAPGGETYADVMDRVSAWLADQPPEPDRRLIVVSHGVAGRLLRAAYAGLDPETAVAQAIPQDAIFALDGGAVRKIDC